MKKEIENIEKQKIFLCKNRQNKELYINKLTGIWKNLFQQRLP